VQGRRQRLCSRLTAAARRRLCSRLQLPAGGSRTAELAAARRPPQVGPAYVVAEGQDKKDEVLAKAARS
jgi:hypothetical protein